MDDSYRNQLRELNELNWERFRSELRAEGVAIRSDVEKRLSEMEKGINERFTDIDARFDGIDARFAAVDARFVALEARFPTFEERIETRFDAKFAHFETRMYKAMFAFWTATIIPLGALILALDGAFQR